MSPWSEARERRTLRLTPGRHTSLELEPSFWARLEALAAAHGVGLAELVARVTRAAGGSNRASCLRVFCLREALDN